jgi:hydroxymethylglutaryl-CoA lyase
MCARVRACANVELWAAGYENAVKTGCSHIAVFTAASETFAQRNINSTIGDSLARYRELCKKAAKDGLQVRGYLSCVLGCPYEGHISPKKVADVAAELHEMGCYEISLGDTIGVGTAGSTHRMLDEVLKRVPLEKVAVHYHDTYGQALANILTSLQFGVATIDASVSGLGGCPYAVGATGNVATEDVVFMLHVRWFHSQ